MPSPARCRRDRWSRAPSAFVSSAASGASDALAAWALLATLVFSALGLALLATAGVVIAEREGSAFDLVGVTVAVLVITIVGRRLCTRSGH